MLMLSLPPVAGRCGSSPSYTYRLPALVLQVWELLELAHILADHCAIWQLGNVCSHPQTLPQAVAAPRSLLDRCDCPCHTASRL